MPTRIFSDTFTGADGTNLDVHAPDTGTGYTIEQQDASAVLEIWGNNCEAESAQANKSVMYSAQPNPTVVEYDLLIDTGPNAFGGTVSAAMHLFARFIDTSNFYVITLYGISTGMKLNKKVAGSFTELASLTEDVDVSADWKFEVRDATKKWFKGVTEKLSSGDNALTSAGKVGIAAGSVIEDIDDVRPETEFDNFRVDEISVAGVTVTVPTATLTTSLFAPVIKLVVIPPKLTLSLATFTPVLGLSVIPPPVALSLTAFVPTVTAIGNVVVTPPTLALSLTAFVPTITATDNQLVTPPALALTLTAFAPTVTAGVYTSYGAPFLYTAANWGGPPGFFLEVFMKASSGTVKARLYNDTDGAAVSGSEVSTTSASHIRLRSASLTLVDGKVYLVQFGTDDGASGAFKAAKIVAI